MSSVEQPAMSDSWATPASSTGSSEMKKHIETPEPQDRTITCLLAEDNPISMKILETLLTRMGCRCVLVPDGSDAISVAMGEISSSIHCLSSPQSTF
jgi:serine/threonine-protein kinase RIM15